MAVSFVYFCLFCLCSFDYVCLFCLCLSLLSMSVSFVHVCLFCLCLSLLSVSFDYARLLCLCLSLLSMSVFFCLFLSLLSLFVSFVSVCLFCLGLSLLSVLFWLCLSLFVTVYDFFISFSFFQWFCSLYSGTTLPWYFPPDELSIRTVSVFDCFLTLFPTIISLAAQSSLTDNIILEVTILETVAF